MAISQTLLQVASRDLATASIVAGMVIPGEIVKNGNRWAKFTKAGSRQYVLTLGDEKGQREEEVTSPAVAKMLVVQHVAPSQAQPDNN